MIALYPFESRIPRDPQRNAVPRAEFLQLGHDAVGNARGGFGVETVHHGLHQLELLLDRKVDEVGVDEDGVGRSEGFVKLEEEGGGDLRSAIKA